MSIAHKPLADLLPHHSTLSQRAPNNRFVSEVEIEEKRAQGTLTTEDGHEEPVRPPTPPEGKHNSLYAAMAEKKRLEEEKIAERNKNMGPAVLDDEDVEFLKEREEQLKELQDIEEKTTKEQLEGFRTQVESLIVKDVEQAEAETAALVTHRKRAASNSQSVHKKKLKKTIRAPIRLNNPSPKKTSTVPDGRSALSLLADDSSSE